LNKKRSATNAEVMEIGALALMESGILWFLSLRNQRYSGQQEQLLKN
jgi:hypothetical protein